MPSEDGVKLRPREAQALANAARRVSDIPNSQASQTRRPSRGSIAQKGTITIINNTDDDLPVFSVVRVARTVTHYEKGIGEDGDITSKSHYWEATAADEKVTGNYAVTVTPTIKGFRGLAIMTGVVRVRLDDTEEGAKANPIVLNTLGMVTGSSGKYHVLSVDVPGTNPTWGHILLGGAGGAAGGGVRSGLIREATVAFPHGHLYSGTWLDVEPTVLPEEPPEDFAWEWVEKGSLQTYSSGVWYSPFNVGDIVGLLTASFTPAGAEIEEEGDQVMGLVTSEAELFSECPCPP